VLCAECVSNGRTKPSVFASSSGNSSLARHLHVAHRIEKGITDDVRQNTLSNQAFLVRHDVMSDHDKHAATTALARLIVAAKLSFKLVESPVFRGFTKSLNKFLPTISRRTLWRCIQDEYDAALPRIRNTINEIPGLVALTYDIWSSRVFRSYFVVTIHWISTTFDMQRLVLEFLHFPSPHDQHNTRDFLLNIINNYKLGPRVRAVTMDSGSKMPPAIQQVRQFLNEQFSLDFGSDFHIRCGCHMRAQLQKLMDLLKVIGLSNTIRQKFKNAQVRLGRLHLRDVPGRGVDTRWS
jgi:hypothetical protein